MAAGAEGTLGLMEVGGSLLERVAVGNPLSLVLAASAFALSLGYLFQLGYRRHVGSDQRVGAGEPQAGERRWSGQGTRGPPPPSHGRGGHRGAAAGEGARRSRAASLQGAGGRTGERRCAGLRTAPPRERGEVGGKSLGSEERSQRLPRDGSWRERGSGWSLRPAGWHQGLLRFAQARGVPGAVPSVQLKRRLPGTAETQL